jgi:hypothetical protein
MAKKVEAYIENVKDEHRYLLLKVQKLVLSVVPKAEVK